MGGLTFSALRRRALMGRIRHMGPLAGRYHRRTIHQYTFRFRRQLGRRVNERFGEAFEQVVACAEGQSLNAYGAQDTVRTTSHREEDA